MYSYVLYGYVLYVFVCMHVYVCMYVCMYGYVYGNVTSIMELYLSNRLHTLQQN